MCQLLGMNCNTPTDICFSFAGFQARGGATDVHADGWGIGFFEGEEGRGCRLFLDPQPSAHSPLAKLVRDYPIRSKNVIAHIRKATQGVVALENTHPFQRELWGRYFLFAHNGNLPADAVALSEASRFRPVGNTDSEGAFCQLLNGLAENFGTHAPADAVIFEHVAEWARTVGARGEFNFLLSNGEWLLVHCSTQLAYIVRQAPFAQAHLKDEDLSVDFAVVTTPNDRVAVIATTPLTDNEVWTVLPAGTLWRFKEGQPVASCQTIAGPKKEGTGPRC
jgi:predicted glutamine amidotransferase